ncbi:MAG: DUF4145 domain-containing protein [Burkholderiales bacterium]
MPNLIQSLLEIPKCPHCGVDTPHLQYVGGFEPRDARGIQRFWAAYACRRCAGVVMAEANGWNHPVLQMFPNASHEISDDIPERARAYLTQAMDSIKSPSGAVILAASAVDAMLKAKNLKAGKLYDRINQAVAQNLLTPDMAKWAHDVRLDANDERHADENAPLPSQQDAARCIEFALALAQFMFVLPARVQRGIQSTKTPE